MGLEAFLMGSGWFCEEKQVKRLNNRWQDRHGVGRGQLCPPKWASQPIWPTQVGGQVGQPRPTYVTCAPHSTNAQPDLGRPVGQGTNSFSSFQFFSWFTNWCWTRKSWRSHYKSWQYGLPKLWWKNWYDGGNNNADDKAMMMMTTRLVAAPCFEIVQPPRSRSAHGGHHPPLQLHHRRHHQVITFTVALPRT